MSRPEEARIAHKALADLHTELLALHKQAKARFRELPSWALIRRESCVGEGEGIVKAGEAVLRHATRYFEQAQVNR